MVPIPRLEPDFESALKVTDMVDAMEQAGPVLRATALAMRSRQVLHLTDDEYNHLQYQEGGTNFVEGPDMGGDYRMHVAARVVDVGLAGLVSAKDMGILEVYEWVSVEATTLGCEWDRHMGLVVVLVGMHNKDYSRGMM